MMFGFELRLVARGNGDVLGDVLRHSGRQNVLRNKQPPQVKEFFFITIRKILLRIVKYVLSYLARELKASVKQFSVENLFFDLQVAIHHLHKVHDY